MQKFPDDFSFIFTLFIYLFLFAFYNERTALDEKKRIGSGIAADSWAGYPEYCLLCIFPWHLLLKL